MKSAAIFLLFFYILIINACSGVDVGTKSQTRLELWEQVPLRSLKQKEAGIIGGEGMQTIFGIAYAPGNPEVVYLVSNTSQVWKSIDGGNSWHMKHEGFFSNGGIAVSVDPINENVVYVAGSLGQASSSSAMDGIYKTTDGGESWELVKRTSFYAKKEGSHFAFHISSTDNFSTKIIYAGTHNDGLLISKDGGESWKTLGFQNEKIVDIKVDPATPSSLYLVAASGLYKVNIENDTISQSERLGSDLMGRIKTFAVHHENPSIIYVAIENEGVYKSIDGGKFFNKLETGLPTNLKYTHIVMSPANPDHLYVSVQEWGGMNPFWSHDGGNSWHQPVSLDMNNDSLVKDKYIANPIAPHPLEADTALTAASTGIIKTVDGGVTWAYSGNGYTGGRKGAGLTSQAFSHDPGEMVFFLIDFGPVLTVDGGETFRLLEVPRVNKVRTTPVGSVSPEADDMIIVTAVGGWDSQTLAVSWDKGEKWDLIPGTKDNYKFITFHPQKPYIIYAQGFISRDKGISWGALSQKIYGMFKGNGDIVYSISEAGSGKAVILRSSDQGTTWSKTYPALPVKAQSVYEMDIDPANPDRIYIASGAGLYIYDDKDKKWLKKDEDNGLIKDSFGLMYFKCVAIDPMHPKVVYTGKWAPGTGQSNGIFRSVDYGETWINITNNLSLPFNVWSVSISPHDGTVYLGSSHGTWRLPAPYFQPAEQ